MGQFVQVFLLDRECVCVHLCSMKKGDAGVGAGTFLMRSLLRASTTVSGSSRRSSYWICYKQLFFCLSLAPS